jgi:hypothetical protein
MHSHATMELKLKCMMYPTVTQGSSAEVPSIHSLLKVLTQFVASCTSAINVRPRFRMGGDYRCGNSMVVVQL